MKTHALWWYGLGLLAAVGLAVFAHVCAVRGGDFLAFYEAAEAALRHGDIYALGARSRMDMLYAPYFSLMLMPLVPLGSYAAALVWFALKVAALALLALWVRAAVTAESSSLRRPGLLVALAFLLLLNPFVGEFKLGQANLLVLFCTVLTVEALSRGRPALAAFVYSVAVVKIAALALLPWLILRRQWKFLAWLGVVGIGWLAALAAWWGPSRVPSLFVSWLAHVHDERANLAKVAYFQNQSLQGAAARLAVAHRALLDPFAGLAAHQWLWILPCAALGAVLAIAAWRDHFRPELSRAEFGICSLLMLLASVDARWAHHIQLLVPLTVLAGEAARSGALDREPADPRTARVVRLLFAAGLVILVVLGQDIVGLRVNQNVRAWSLHTVFDLALAAFLCVRILRPVVTPEARLRSHPET